MNSLAIACKKIKLKNLYELLGEKGVLEEKDLVHLNVGDFRTKFVRPIDLIKFDEDLVSFVREICEAYKDEDNDKMDVDEVTEVDCFVGAASLVEITGKVDSINGLYQLSTSNGERLYVDKSDPRRIAKYWRGCWCFMSESEDSGPMGFAVISSEPQKPLEECTQVPVSVYIRQNGDYFDLNETYDTKAASQFTILLLDLKLPMRAVEKLKEKYLEVDDDKFLEVDGIITKKLLDDIAQEINATMSQEITKGAYSERRRKESIDAAAASSKLQLLLEYSRRECEKQKKWSLDKVSSQLEFETTSIEQINELLTTSDVEIQPTEKARLILSTSKSNHLNRASDLKVLRTQLRRDGASSSTPLQPMLPKNSTLKQRKEKKVLWNKTVEDPTERKNRLHLERQRELMRLSMERIKSTVQHNEEGEDSVLAKKLQKLEDLKYLRQQEARRLADKPLHSSSDSSWKCTLCQNLNQNTDAKCTACYTKKPWTCTSCRTVNAGFEAVCINTRCYTNPYSGYSSSLRSKLSSTSFVTAQQSKRNSTPVPGRDKINRADSCSESTNSRHYEDSARKSSSTSSSAPSHLNSTTSSPPDLSVGKTIDPSASSVTAQPSKRNPTPVPERDSTNRADSSYKSSSSRHYENSKSISTITSSSSSPPLYSSFSASSSSGPSTVNTLDYGRICNEGTTKNGNDETPRYATERNNSRSLSRRVCSEYSAVARLGDAKERSNGVSSSPREYSEKTRNRDPKKCTPNTVFTSISTKEPKNGVLCLRRANSY